MRILALRIIVLAIVSALVVMIFPGLTQPQYMLIGAFSGVLCTCVVHD